MTSDCYSCHAMKEDFTEDLCRACQERKAGIKEQIAKDQPEATPDQVLYLTREAMKAGGWHPRAGWTDPRLHSRAPSGS